MDARLETGRGICEFDKTEIGFSPKQVRDASAKALLAKNTNMGLCSVATPTTSKRINRVTQTTVIVFTWQVGDVHVKNTNRAGAQKYV